MAEFTHQNDEYYLFLVFPQLIWEEILNKLETNLELHVLKNVSNSSPYFYRLLQHQRTLFLFPSVFKVVSSNQDSLWKYNRNIFHSELYFSLRQVCRAWCRTVSDLEPRRKYQSFTTLVGGEEAQFLTHFEKSHPPTSARGPFIGNTLVLPPVVYEPTRQEENDYIPFQKVLQVYGHHVDRCILSLGNLKAKQLLKTTLRYLLKLRTFELTLPEYLAIDTDSYCRFICKLEFPLLTHLHTLNVKNARPYELQKLVVQTPNLKRLKVHFFTQINAPCNHQFGESLRKLQLLSLKVDTEYDGMTCEFIRAHCLTPKFRYCEDRYRVDDIPDWMEVTFKILEANEGLPITDLKLSLEWDRYAAWHLHRLSAAYPLRFPHLKNFTLKTGNWPCIDCLLPFSNTLENITIMVVAGASWKLWRKYRPDEMVREEKIKFLDCCDNMMYSNIWNLLPKLQSVTVGYLPIGKEKYVLKSWNRQDWKRWIRQPYYIRRMKRFKRSTNTKIIFIKNSIMSIRRRSSSR